MTIFYLILYKIWKIRFDIKDSKTLDIIMYVLAILRIILCFFPQNQWFVNNPPVVIWASENFLVGMLMIPKTLAYVWVVLIGYKEFKKTIK
jgi:hypothetical protein